MRRQGPRSPTLRARSCIGARGAIANCSQGPAHAPIDALMCHRPSPIWRLAHARRAAIGPQQTATSFRLPTCRKSPISTTKAPRARWREKSAPLSWRQRSRTAFPELRRNAAAPAPAQLAMSMWMTSGARRLAKPSPMEEDMLDFGYRCETELAPVLPDQSDRRARRPRRANARTSGLRDAERAGADG